MRAIAAVEGVLTPIEVDPPRALGHQVVVSTAAIGVNRADVLQRRGLYPSPAGWPHWPGLELSGTVLEVGELVTRFSPGDSVVALVGGGAYAHRVAAHEDLLLPAPPAIGLLDAAALPEAACTVVSMLDAAGAMPGDTVLVHGGSGGIGTFAIQWAVAAGMRVIATAGTAERALRCEDLGAEAGIDHSSTDFVDATKDLGGANVILDVVGGAYLERNIAALAPGGTLAVIGLQQGAQATVDLRALMTGRHRIVAATLRGRPHEERAAIVASVGRRVWPLIGNGIVPVIHATMPLDDAAEAHRALEAGEVFGKIVLTP